MRKELTEKEIESIVQETKEAYSFERYGLDAWIQSIKNLYALGHTKKMIVKILYHKVMRWAADSFAEVKMGVEQCDGNEILKYYNQYAKDGKISLK
jgi:hypothetical protein